MNKKVLKLLKLKVQELEMKEMEIKSPLQQPLTETKTRLGRNKSEEWIKEEKKKLKLLLLKMK